MKCGYCGTENKEYGHCSQCGAEIAKNEEYKDRIKGDPFFYNGYVVYFIRYIMLDSLEVQFWLGKELQGRFAISRRWLEDNVPEGTDPMPKFWDMFLLAKGEKEVLHWKDINNKPYIRYEVRRIDESPSLFEFLDT